MIGIFIKYDSIKKLIANHCLKEKSNDVDDDIDDVVKSLT